MAKTILIIDDEKSVRKTLSRFLEREGYNVTTAEGVEEARGLIAEADLVMSDIRLGDGNGIEFLDELRCQGFDKPVLLMSGFLIDTEIEKAIELTGFPVIQKPTSFEEIFRIVEGILAG